PLKKSAEVQLVRDGQPVTAHVTIEEQPTDFDNPGAPAPRQPVRTPTSSALPTIGAEVADLTDAMAEDYGYKAGTQGAVITQVEQGSVGAEAGLRKGMLIAKVDNHAVTSAAQARQSVQAASLE